MEKINVTRAKNLASILSGKTPAPSRYDAKLQEMEKREPFLFYYTLWTFVENKQHSTLTEAQAKSKLAQYPRMQVIVCKVRNSTSKPPAILKDRKITKEEVNSHEQLSELIYLKTGCSVPESDLMNKKTINQSRREAWEKKSLAGQNRGLNLAKAKRAEETKARILKCLQENDPRKRKECLNNCKTK